MEKLSANLVRRFTQTKKRLYHNQRDFITNNVQISQMHFIHLIENYISKLLLNLIQVTLFSHTYSISFLVMHFKYISINFINT